MKIIQVCQAYGDSMACFALCEDGTLWYCAYDEALKQWNWVQVGLPK